MKLGTGCIQMTHVHANQVSSLSYRFRRPALPSRLLSPRFYHSAMQCNLHPYRVLVRACINRKNERLSKPSPDVVVLSEEQARNVDIGRKIIRERRRRGARR